MVITINRRIKYYSSSDLSSGYHLQQAEPILLQEEKSFTDYDINDVIELYNIGLFFENNIYLKSWDDEKKKIYIARVNSKGLSHKELPTELQNIQGIDMSKIGAMQDLLHGIDKIFRYFKYSSIILTIV